MKKKNEKGILKYRGILIVILCFVFVIVLFKSRYILVKDNDIYSSEKNINIYKPEEKMLESTILPKSYSFSIPIFMYHFILDDYGKATDSENFMPPKKLEEQIKYIVDNGYTPVYVTEFDELYKYTKPVALTFDDCFVYYYNNAFPILKKYNVKSSIFVITDYINGPNYLTTDQLKEIKASGIVDIESHTLTHPDLTKLKDDELKKEVVQSKNKLKELFDIDSNVFCYPYGIFNNKVVDVVKQNYTSSLDMVGGVYHSNKHNIYKIPRIYANRSMPMSTFVNYLKQSKVNVTW